MSRCPVDFRSDTVTLPNQSMKEFAMSCPLGDDVYGEDPTVNKLEKKVAKILGKEAAVFFPTGTQSNLAAVMSHCQRGEEMLIGDQYHIFQHEARGASVLGGIAMHAIPTDRFGKIRADDVIAAIKDDDPHYPVTKLVSLENTVSGCVIDASQISDVAQRSHAAGIAVHLDGARLFNASVALGRSAEDIVKHVDTVSLCLSKGLGAPAGSLLAGNESIAKSARRQRKILGGGMRQAGIIAGCGLYAVENNVERLVEDHRVAAFLARELSRHEALGVDVERTQTNMVFLQPQSDCAEDLCEFLLRNRINLGALNPSIRMVVHMGVTEEGAARTIELVDTFFRNRKK